MYFLLDDVIQKCFQKVNIENVISLSTIQQHNQLISYYNDNMTILATTNNEKASMLYTYST